LTINITTILNQNTGVVTYTPNSGFTNSDNFMFKVNDGKTDSNSGLVTIAVQQEQKKEEEQIPISPTTSIADEITKLANLRDRGSISEQEFSQLKLDIIAKSNSGSNYNDGIPISDEITPATGGNSNILAGSVDELTEIDEIRPATGSGNINTKPISNAGPDIVTKPGQRIQLQGSGSDINGDPIITYKWEKISGSDVEWEGSKTVAKPIIFIPGTTYKSVLTFELIVNDGKVDSEPDFMDVYVHGPIPPGKVPFCFDNPAAEFVDLSGVNSCNIEKVSKKEENETISTNKKSESPRPNEKFPKSELPVEGERPYSPPKQKGNPEIVPEKGGGFKDKDGNIWKWAKDQHGGPHWDVQHPNGSHTNVGPNGNVIGGPMKDNFPNKSK
jgi:putative RNase toxin 37 of polymorphic toxin system/K319-like protein/Big-like domain-containing protein